MQQRCVVLSAYVTLKHKKTTTRPSQLAKMIVDEAINDERRYILVVCTGAVIHPISVNTHIAKASTSIVVHQNLEHAEALHFTHYNFARI